MSAFLLIQQGVMRENQGGLCKVETKPPIKAEDESSFTFLMPGCHLEAALENVLHLYIIHFVL